MARYELVDGTSRKFWEIALDGPAFTVRFGRIGAAGQTQTETFPSPDRARAEHDRLVAEKGKKGYRPVEGASASAATTFRRDVHVPNESDGFVFASGAMRGRGLMPGGGAWQGAVAACDIR